MRSSLNLRRFLTFFLAALPYSGHLVSSTGIVGALPVDSIHFCVTNHGGCSFVLDANASVLDLKRTIADAYDISFRFEIQLFEQTIVSSKTSINQKINELPHLIPVANDLYQIWGKGFITPIRVHPIRRTSQHNTVFTSLSELFGGAESNVHQFEWYRFILHCAESVSCTIQHLCDHFGEYFVCEDGQLIIIKLHQKLTGHIDLNFVPETLTTLMLDRNSFTEIFGLDQLAGKQLRYLDVRGNPLEIDLQPLMNSSVGSIHNPMRYMRVSIYQISWSLLRLRPKQYLDYRLQGDFSDAVHRAMAVWFQVSILDGMTLGRNRWRKTKDGQFIQYGRGLCLRKEVIEEREW